MCDTLRWPCITSAKASEKLVINSGARDITRKVTEVLRVLGQVCLCNLWLLPAGLVGYVGCCFLLFVEMLGWF